MKYIKVFGIEASGTKFLIDLLKANTYSSTIFSHEIGSTHGIPLNLKEIQRWFKTEKRPTQELIRFIKALSGKHNYIYPIIIIKNPYLWYKDMSNHRGKKNFDLNREFEIYNSTYNIYKDLIEYNTERYSGLYAKGLYIKYEDLLEHPSSEINKISTYCDVRMKLDKDFTVPKHINKRDRDFYLKGAPWKLDEIRLINIQRRVDWKLMQYYEYYPIDVVEAYNSQYVKRI